MQPTGEKCQVPSRWHHLHVHEDAIFHTLFTFTVRFSLATFDNAETRDAGNFPVCVRPCLRDGTRQRPCSWAEVLISAPWTGGGGHTSRLAWVLSALDPTAFPAAWNQPTEPEVWPPSAPSNSTGWCLLFQTPSPVSTLPLAHASWASPWAWGSFAPPDPMPHLCINYSHWHCPPDHPACSLAKRTEVVIIKSRLWTFREMIPKF